MIHSSQIFKNKQLLYFLLLSLLAALLLGIFYSFLATTLLVLFIVAGLFINPEDSRDQELLSQMSKVMKEAGNGNLEGRITNIPKESRYFDIAWGYNNLVDQGEAFMRDTIRGIDLATNNDANAIIFSQGLRGSFKNAVEPLNMALQGIISGKVLEVQGKLSREFDKLGGGTTGAMKDIKHDITYGSELMEKNRPTLNRDS